MQFTTAFSRFAIGTTGVIVGAYCAFTAYRNGLSLAGGIDGIAFGAAFASIVIGSWFLLPLAASASWPRAMIMRIGWAMCLAFVLINAIGFTAGHRTSTVGGKANAIRAYDAALVSLKQAQEQLSAMKDNPRWEATSGCTDATVPKSIAFCRRVAQAQTMAASHQSVISAGKPATADAQADTIAWATQINAAIVSKAMPIFWALVLDIGASLFIWAALTTEAGQSAEAETRVRARKQGRAAAKVEAGVPASPVEQKRRAKRDADEKELTGFFVPKPKQPNKKRWTQKQTIAYLDKVLNDQAKAPA